VHPDALSWGPNFQGVDIPTATFFAREFVDGQWADRYGLWFNHTGGKCSGPFNIWRSVKGGDPVMDFVVGSCDAPQPMAQTRWQKMIREQPALELFQMDFSSCRSDDSALLGSHELPGHSHGVRVIGNALKHIANSFANTSVDDHLVV